MDYQKIENRDLQRRLRKLEGTLKSLYPNKDNERLLQELAEHQIELELQCRELSKTQQATQQALDESRHSFTDLYDFAPIGFITLDDQGVIQQINLAGAELLATDRSRLIQVPLPEFIHLDHDAFFHHLDETLSSGRREIVELRIRDANQALHYVRVYSLAHQERGQSKTCFSAIIDITVDRQHRQRVQLQNTLLNQMQEGVMLIRQADCVVLETNAAFDQMFGYEPAELTGRHISVLHAGGRRKSQGLAREIAGELKRLGKWQGELHTIRKDGTEFWCEASMSAFDHQDYGPIWLTVQRDVTWRKQTEDALRESERFAYTVLNGLPAQILVLDERATIVAANEAWRQLARENKLPPELCEGVGRNIQDLCRWMCGSLCIPGVKVMAGIEAVIKGQKPLFATEFACHGSHRQQRWFMLHVTPRGDGDKGAIVSYLDVTARKLAEAEAREHRDELARVMRLNTVSALSSALAHEITQPLTAINYYSDAALSLIKQKEAKPPPPELYKILNDINRQVHRASEIMRRLRDFMGHGRAQKTCVDTKEIIENATSLVNPLARKQNITITQHLSPEPQYVMADRIQIEQVVVNLLYNSIEAINSAQCDQRDITVDEIQRPGEVEILVRDTGPGVDSQMLKNMFNVFQTSKQTGMGLGLSISRSMVEAHHGKLWADQGGGGKGALFHLTLPRCKKGAASESA